VAGLKDKLIDVLIGCQPLRTLGMAHGLMRPFVDPSGFPVRCSMGAQLTPGHFDYRPLLNTSLCDESLQPSFRV
jgi:hypothetical protein